MSEDFPDLKWSWQELLRGGLVMLSVFVVMYSLVVVEVAMSFRYPPEGPILRLFQLRFSSQEAGYYMVLTLAVLGIVGAVLCYYGFKWIRRGLWERRG